MPASRSQLSPDVYIKEAPLRESSDFMLFSHPHHLWGVDWYVGGQNIFCSCMTNGQCPQQMTSWISAKYWMFFSKSFLCQMTRLILGATTPLPAQIFLRTSFCQFCRRSSATWTKNTWKLQIPAKSHKNYFGRLTAKFQQTAISSICLGAFKRFSTMISASFGNLISARGVKPIYLNTTQPKICQALLCFQVASSFRILKRGQGLNMIFKYYRQIF